MSISGHFFGNYIRIFQKTEVLTVILMGPTPSITDGVHRNENFKEIIPVFFSYKIENKRK